LAERGVAVVVLEATAIGSGGSGASGGQVIPGLRHFPTELTRAYGADLGHRLLTFGAGDADATFALIARHQIDCAAHRGGWLQVADTAIGVAEGERRARAWAERGAPIEILSRDATAAVLGSTAYLGGWRDGRGGSVNPLAYVRGLGRAALHAGATIHTDSAVEALRRDGPDWVVATATGQVRCQRVLLATNAGTLPMLAPVAPWLNQCQLAVWSYQIATPIGPSHTILPGAPVVSDTRRVLRYFRLDPAGRLVIGGKGLGRAPRSISDFALQRHMRASLYPALRDAEISHAWGGRIGITLDRLPRLFTLGPGAWAILQDNGKGIAWNTASGAPLADLLAGTPAEQLPLVPATALSPIPFAWARRWYVAAGNAWLRARDRLEGAR
jgi:glycine/D-amino acid oxidase-like deaminating enzyme